MNLIYTIITVFGITAILGMYLLSLVLRNKETPKGFSFTHGIFAFIGLALLIYYCLSDSAGPMESLIVFSVTAIGGFVLIYKDLTAQPIPKWLAIFHGVAAIAGFTLLVIFACQDMGLYQ